MPPARPLVARDTYVPGVHLAEFQTRMVVWQSDTRRTRDVVQLPFQ